MGFGRVGESSANTPNNGNSSGLNPHGLDLKRADLLRSQSMKIAEDEKVRITVDPLEPSFELRKNLQDGFDLLAFAANVRFRSPRFYLPNGFERHFRHRTPL